MLNVAVIGLGNMGRHHARVLSELEEAKLVAVSDLDEKQGRKIAQRYGSVFYKDYKEMLDRGDIDAVSVAVPTSLHKEVALECIKRGIPALIEKPIADSPEAGEEIVQAAEKEGVFLAVGHVERFNPAVQKLKEIIEQNRLERITSVVARRVGIFPPQVKDADVIVDLAVHDIDVCNFLLNRRPRRIYARAGKALNSKRADFAGLFLDYDGVDVFIQVNWITPVKIRELNVTGTKGYVELNYITQKLKIYESNYEKSFDSFGDFVVKFGTPNVQEVHVKTGEPLKIELENFIKCLQSKRPEKRLWVSGEEGLHILETASLAVRSYKLNKIMETKE